MLHSVEGVSNLFLINSFLNKENINQSVDIKKKIEYDILHDRTVINCDGQTDRIYKDILEVLNEKDNVSGGSSMSSVAPKVVKKDVEVQDFIVPPVTNLASTFRVEPKPQQEPAQLTPYEVDSYNKILYSAGKNVYDDDMEDERISMLESIDDLRNELNSMEGVNIKTIPPVDKNSSIHDIKSVYKLLLQKKNMSMYFDTAKDVVLIGINKLVNFCDGRPGRPNLTGWERTANLRLNSLRTEMANMVSGFFKDYNIPPILQILFSLVPSAFLHASLRERQSGLQATNNTALNDLRKMMD